MTLRKKLDTPRVAGVVFSLPFIIGFIAFTMIPMIICLYYSFCRYDILTPPVWIGGANYVELLTGDKRFWVSVLNTGLYAFASVPVKLVFALLVALLLVRQTKATAVYRAAYYIPSLLGGSVAIAVLWRRMFASDGVINAILNMLGVAVGNTAWLGRPQTSLWVLTLLPVWQFGSSMLIFVSALKQIPTTLYEAARVDGARRLSVFGRITLPLLTPTIFFNLVMQMISGFLVFTQVAIITDGKPMYSTLVCALYMYKQSFVYNRAGYGAAMAWVMLAMIGLFTLVLFATKRFWVCSDEM